jgi:ABC-type glycerol-3-phosphate transport system substrate-binding protein
MMPVAWRDAAATAHRELLVFPALPGNDPGQNILGRSVMIVTIGYRFAAAAGIAASLAAILPARAQSLDDFYAKAKDEGAFAFYVGGPTAPWEARAKVFEERFPGVKVTIGGGFSNVLDQKVDAQLAAGKLEVDAVIFQTAGDFGRWKAEGRLLTFKPDGFNKMDAAFKDADGTFWATMVNVVPYMYNTEKVAAADIPNAATDFLKPQFKGKIVTGPCWAPSSRTRRIRTQRNCSCHGC